MAPGHFRRKAAGMAIFSSGSVQTTTVTNSATKVFDTTSSLYATGATLTNLTLVNTGSTTCFVGIASVTTTGLRLAAGQQLTIYGYSYAKSDTTGDVYAITASGTTTIQAGLATVDATV
jgi:hypothetical protein